MNRRVVMSLVGITVFLATTADTCNTSGGTAAGSSASSGSGVTTVAQGQPMKESSGEQVTVTAFAAGVTDPNALETLKAGQQCVKVSVSVNNGSTNEWILPLSEMSVVDASGQKYDADNGIGTCPSGSSEISSLVAGGKAVADLVYQVPSSGGLLFNWTPTLSGQVFQTTLK